MKRLFQKLAIWFYEKMGCREMAHSDFWTHHILYSVPKEVDSKIIVSELNRVSGEIEHKGDWTRSEGFKNG